MEDRIDEWRDRICVYGTLVEHALELGHGIYGLCVHSYIGWIPFGMISLIMHSKTSLECVRRTRDIPL